MEEEVKEDGGENGSSEAPVVEPMVEDNERAEDAGTSGELNKKIVVFKEPVFLRPRPGKKPASRHSDNSGPEEILLQVTNVKIPYEEPPWKGIPESSYTLEELKSGVIKRVCDLSGRSFVMIGRGTGCHMQLPHPSLSRYHAVLQYRAVADEDLPPGFYICDMGSVHGTFLNKNRLKSKIYVRIRVGHVLKFGCSSRLYVLQGPDMDQEEESELSVTEIKEKRAAELAERARKAEEAKLEEERRLQAIEDRGVDWGMGEDAEEETDLKENPYAVTTNEELYLDNPHKTLKGWFEREGEELLLKYSMAEKGNHVCRLTLPVDSGSGKEVVIEGKAKSKKEAAAQCELEACRYIDKLGLLRQSHHEARKRQTRNWEENDYYDSDEDSFLDRTGELEKKRKKRMEKAGKVESGVETYQSLMEKHAGVIKQVEELERKVAELERARKAGSMDQAEGDSLDNFMATLTQQPPNKLEIRRAKSELASLKAEEERLSRLVEIARPSELPQLKPAQELRLNPPQSNKPSQPKPVKSPELKADEEPTTIEKVATEPSEPAPTPEPELKKPNPKNPKVQESRVGPLGPAKPPSKPDKSKKRSKVNPLAQASGADWDEDYVDWQPPSGQTGDGRTALNDKLGY